ncbi:MAG: hypothetical protein AAFZ15_21455 [Bacteroidota bacterium]
MNVSQKINHLNDNSYDDDITVTDVPQGQFLAITANSIANGATTREISISLMSLEQAPGGTRTTNTNLFVRQGGETAIQVKVYAVDGTELASNTQDYS